LEAWFAGRPDLIVANAEAGRRAAVARGMPADRIAVVPNGIARDQFACDPQARAAIRAEWGIPEGVPVIGHVARLDPMKDHATFVAALAGLDALCPRPWRAVLVVEGMPGARAGLTAEVARLGLVARVTVLPGSDEVAACYAGFDLFCQSSAYGEGFPNVVGEAMASGLVVVATDVGDTALVLGSTGQVVAPGDPVALARALAAELRRREDQPAEQLAAIAAQIARFDVENLVDRTERLLLSVMRR
jgi:glycosyltransferase involved in cell wall biosynthesis